MFLDTVLVILVVIVNNSEPTEGQKGGYPVKFCPFSRGQLVSCMTNGHTVINSHGASVGLPATTMLSQIPTA